MPFVRLRRSLGIGRGEFASRGSVTQHCDNMAAACNVPCRKKTESMSPSETRLVIRRPITECIAAKCYLRRGGHTNDRRGHSISVLDTQTYGLGGGRECKIQRENVATVGGLRG